MSSDPAPAREVTFDAHTISVAMELSGKQPGEALRILLEEATNIPWQDSVRTLTGGCFGLTIRGSSLTFGSGEKLREGHNGQRLEHLVLSAVGHRELEGLIRWRSLPRAAQDSAWAEYLQDHKDAVQLLTLDFLRYIATHAALFDGSVPLNHMGG